MAMLLKHPSRCFKCSRWMEGGEGFLTRRNKVWWGHCFSCYYKDRTYIPSIYQDIVDRQNAEPTNATTTTPNASKT